MCAGEVHTRGILSSVSGNEMIVHATFPSQTRVEQHVETGGWGGITGEEKWKGTLLESKDVQQDGCYLSAYSYE